MMPRARRVPRALFPSRAHKRLEGPHFSATLTPLPAGHRGDGVATAVVSKKVARRSVDRHLLKRRILAVLEESFVRGHITIVYARSGAAALPFRVIRQELTSLLSRT